MYRKQTCFKTILLLIACLVTGCFGVGCFTAATWDHLGETRSYHTDHHYEYSQDGSEIIEYWETKTEHDCWPFLTAFEIYWNTYDSGEKHVPVNESYGVDVNQEQAYPSGRGILLAPKIGPVGWCWKVIWLPSAMAVDIVCLPGYAYFLYLFIHTPFIQ